MYRCVIACVAAATLSLPASAQMRREFPQNALRGTIEFGAPPGLLLNGNPTLLAPGARIRAHSNLLVMSAEVSGQRHIVNYTLDASGVVRDVWLLRPEEAAVRPWPTTTEQAATWSFSPAGQTWTRP